MIILLAPSHANRVNKWTKLRPFRHIRHTALSARMPTHGKRVH